MWITLDQIQCLQTIKESGSMTSAAEILHKAKSAISYTIQKLDEQLGFATLDRREYRIKLTPKGEAFLLKARPLLADYEALKEEVHKIAMGVEMQVRISATAIYPTAKLNKVLKDLMAQYPSTQFTFHREILSGEKMLLNETVDIGIFENLQNTMDLEGKKIGEVDLKLVIASSHPFLKLPKKEQTMNTLAALYPHIIQRSTIQDGLTMGSPSEAKKWTVSDIDSKKELICEGLGWGRLPDYFISKELKNKSLVHLEHLKYDHCVDVFVSRKRGKPFGPVLKKIWDAF